MAVDTEKSHAVESLLGKDLILSVADKNLGVPLVELPFDIRRLAKSCSSRHVVTTIRLCGGRLTYSETDVVRKPGFPPIEGVSLRVTYDATERRLKRTTNRTRSFHHKHLIKPNESVENLDIEPENKITTGEFVDQ